MPGLVIPAGDFRACLFDLDGTVADSMPVHFLAWTQAVEEAGGRFSRELFFSLAGIPIVRTVEILNERFGYTMPPQATAQRKEDLYYERIAEVKPVAQVLDYMRAMQGKVLFAIVSGSGRESIGRTLDALGLAGYFNVIVGAEDYVHGKPHPEPFLTAAKLLGVAPRDCLVFEDADAGIEAATAAGMQWVRVPHSAIADVAESGGAVLESNT